MSNVSPHMSRVRTFQALVAASTLLAVAWYALPYLPLVYLPPEVQNLLQADGAAGSPIVLSPWYYNSAFAARIAAGVALFFLLWWGRWLLVLVLASDLVSVLFSGVAVTPPLDQLVYVLMYMCEGAVVVIAFSEPLSLVLQRRYLEGDAHEG
jgi:hypothetical protein